MVNFKTMPCSSALRDETPRLFRKHLRTTYFCSFHIWDRPLPPHVNGVYLSSTERLNMEPKRDLTQDTYTIYKINVTLLGIYTLYLS